jgi:hypothetical protein
MVPKQVVQRVPLSYYDPFSPAIVSGYSSFSPAVTSSTVISSKPIVSQPAESMGQSVLEPPSSSDNTPRTKLKKVEIGEPEKADSDASSDAEADDAEADDADDVRTDDTEELLPPALNDQEDSNPEGADGQNVGWRIRWNPVYAHEV